MRRRVLAIATIASLFASALGASAEPTAAGLWEQVDE